MNNIKRQKVEGTDAQQNSFGRLSTRESPLLIIERPNDQKRVLMQKILEKMSLKKQSMAV